MREVELGEAKASFSSVVNRAVAGDPTVVTCPGKPVAVVLGDEEWKAIQGVRPSFADLLLSFPDAGEIARDPAPPRDLGL